MNNLALLWLLMGSVVTVFIMAYPTSVLGQSGLSSSTLAKPTSSNGTSISISASIAVEVSNETLKAKESLLRSAVVSFLNSGPNVLKTPTQADQPIVKSKIENRVSKATQNVEGIEATNAIIGVEIGKALKSIVSSGPKQNQTALITLETSSTCNPGTQNLLSCSNTVVIK